jgi:hypothetical protein
VLKSPGYRGLACGVPNITFGAPGMINVGYPVDAIGLRGETGPSEPTEYAMDPMEFGAKGAK